MVKNFAFGVLLVVITGLLIFGAVNQTMANNDPSSEARGSGLKNTATPQPGAQVATGNSYGQGNGGSRNGRTSNGTGSFQNLPPAQDGDLSADELAALSYMREEEKLAHDVYVMLYANWGLTIFQNISQSELTHTNAVKALIDRYGIEDPVSKGIGVFSNPDLQDLYDDLISRGSQSLAEALKVGTAIEEIDILDLKSRLERTDNADIQQVFANLERGSENHLRAFVSTLNQQTGEFYQPQYLSAEEYKLIIESAMGNGRSQGYGQGGRGSGQRGKGGRP